MWQRQAVEGQSFDSWRLLALVLAASCIASPAQAGDHVYNASAGR
jgi:hypothetical protein